MGGSQDWVLLAPQVASAGPLTAVRGLLALGRGGGSWTRRLRASDGSS